MTDYVTISNLYNAAGSAGRQAEQTALAMMARHLRYDHGMSWAKIAESLGVSVREVRKVVAG